MRFCANLGFLFKEVLFLERFGKAAQAGFGAVEFPWPAGEDLDQVEAAIREAGVEVALFNFDAGNLATGDRGLLSDPEHQGQFRENVPVALDLARRIGCRRLNALVGKELPGLDRADQIDLARRNVAWAADQARVIDADILIEAINTFENGPYLVSTSRASAEFIRQVGRENVKIQYDVYHMQRMEGNLVATLQERIGEIGHIQIADSPGRGEPGTGEINYAYVLAEIDRLGYGGYVGLEYNPTTPTTEESLTWLPEERRGAVPVHALRLPSR